MAGHVSLKVPGAAIKLLDTQRVAHVPLRFFSCVCVLLHIIFDTLKLVRPAVSKPRFHNFFSASIYRPEIAHTHTHTGNDEIFTWQTLRHFSYLWIFSYTREPFAVSMHIFII